MLKHTLPIMLLGLALSWPVEAARSYGPVKEQDTLWNIATQLRPDNNATVQQTMLALYYKNPQAFNSNNINSLMKGVTLKAPSSAEVRRYQRIDALREARKHNNYWKRGANLPKTTPPPVPKLKERPPQARSKPAKPVATKTTVSYATTPKSTNRRIAKLQTQLQAAETKNQQLTAELQVLQSKQSKGKPNPELDAQVKKLKSELRELTTVLDQKDNHIKTLQSSLKNASETIKAQHNDNIRLYDKLKEVSPSSVPTPPSSEGKSELKLTTVEAATAAVTSADASKTAAATTNTASTTKASETKPDTTTSTTQAGNQAAPAKSVWADEQKAATDKTTKPNTEGSEAKATTNSANPTAETKVANSTEPAKIEAPTLAAAMQSTTSPAPEKVNGEAANTAATKPTTEASKTEANKPEPKPAEPEVGTSTAATANPVTGKTPTESANTEATKTDATSTASKVAAIPAEANKAASTAKTADSTTAEAANQDKTTGGVASKTPSAAETTNKPNSDIKAPSTQAAANLAPTNDVKTSSSVPVSTLLAQSNNEARTNDKPTSSSAPLRGVSPLALAVALISLLFILALAWRAFLQQREMRRLEKEEAQVAERMRKRLDDNQATVVTTATLVDKKDPDLDEEIKF